MLLRASSSGSTGNLEALSVEVHSPAPVRRRCRRLRVRYQAAAPKSPTAVQANQGGIGSLTEPAREAGAGSGVAVAACAARSAFASALVSVATSSNTPVATSAPAAAAQSQVSASSTTDAAKTFLARACPARPSGNRSAKPRRMDLGKLRGVDVKNSTVTTEGGPCAEDLDQKTRSERQRLQISLRTI